MLGAGLAAAGLALAACGFVGTLAGSSTSIGGSVTVDRVVTVDPFFDPASATALDGSPVVSAAPLATFDVPGPDEGVTGGSVVPIGRLGRLDVGRWSARDDDLGPMDCVGFTFEDGTSGSECTQTGAADPAPLVLFQADCRDDSASTLVVFTVDPSVVALRLESATVGTVVGADTARTGLVAVETNGTDALATAQTADGRVWAVPLTVTCPAV